MKLAIAIITAAAALQGCADEMHQANAVDTTVTTSADIAANESHPFVRHADWPDLGHGVERDTTLKFGPDELATCRGVTPRFPLESTRVMLRFRPELEALASCLNHPMMRDQTVLLVGRTDPEGTGAYNAALGLMRAQAIADLLKHDGVDAARIEITSAGETEASTRTDMSYGYDRRVDVIVRGVHAPR